MSEEDQNIIKCFTQCPNMLLYGLPQLPLQDKWALITLMGLCWDRSQTGKTLEELEGPYKLSLREISSLTGVDHTSLRNKRGKSPREGVLDRLERFGYLTVCEGYPIEEYTGTLGRVQTYLYIRLRRIWEENQSFADAWRVPTNRLVREELVEFTVDHANGHVDVDNSSVDHANSHVDQDNDTVDGASTKYVLRQCNIKKTKEDKRKILASDDATPSLSQEELNELAFKFISKKKEVTYYELEVYLQKFANMKGENTLVLPFKNAFAWNGVNSQFNAMVIGLLNEAKITVRLCPASRYDKGRKLAMPLATSSEDHDSPQWHPQVIQVVEDHPF